MVITSQYTLLSFVLQIIIEIKNYKRSQHQVLLYTFWGGQKNILFCHNKWWHTFFSCAVKKITRNPKWFAWINKTTMCFKVLWRWQESNLVFKTFPTGSSHPGFIKRKNFISRGNSCFFLLLLQLSSSAWNNLQLVYWKEFGPLFFAELLLIQLYVSILKHEQSLWAHTELSFMVCGYDMD